MYKLITSDIDGTLVNSESEVSDYTKETIKKLIDKGVHFVVATGRGYRGAKLIADALNLKHEIICNNGSTIYDYEGNLIFQRIIDKKTSEKIFKKVYNTNSVFFACYGDQLFIDEGKYDKTLDYIHFPLERFIMLTPENIKDYDFEKIVVMERDFDTLKKFEEEFVDIEGINAFISQHFFLDIVHFESSKGTALKFLADLKNVKLEETLAFGDAFNDYEMLKCAGRGIVMANGFDELKKEFETNHLTNDEDGVAVYLNNIYELN